MKKYIFIFIFLCFYSLPAQADNLKIIDTHSFIDQSGYKIIINSNFKKIISLYPAHTENICALGQESSLVGISCNADYPSLNKQRLSRHDGPERFLSLKPDLILIRPMLQRAHPQLFASLRKLGIIVVSLQPGSIQEMYTYWQILGMLTGAQKQAQKMIADFQAQIKNFKQLSSTIINPKKVFFESMHRQIRTFSAGATTLFALQMAGGVNIAPDAVCLRKSNIAEFGREKLISKAKDIDVYLSQQGIMNKVTIQTIKQSPGFELIKAVQNNQIYLIPEGIVSRPTSRLIQGICFIGKKLYPHIYTSVCK